MEFDSAKIDSIWTLSHAEKKWLKLSAIETDNYGPLYCAICNHLLKVGDRIATYKGLNCHFYCFKQSVDWMYRPFQLAKENALRDQIRLLDVRIASIQDRIKQLE
jgi:hypothetical protein